METMISVDYLDVYKALASPVRLKLIKLLSAVCKIKLEK